MSDQHLSLDALADLLVGEGDADAVAHVAGCPRCSTALTDLDTAQPEVDDLLRAEAARPLPPAPDDLVQRLLALLPAPEPAEPVSTGTGAGGSTVLPGGQVVRLRERPSRRPPLLGLAAGAAGVLVLVGLGVAVSHGSRGSSDAASTSAAARPSVAAPDLPVLATGNDYTDAASVSRALPGLLRGGDAASTERQPTAGLAAPAAPAPAPAPATVPDPLARLHDPAQLAGCLGELTDPGSDALPLALDYARFHGQPALTVVLPSARAGQVDVYVVGAGCTAGDDRTLFFTRLPRP